jgi:Domain of unknown function (DUF5666)
MKKQSISTITRRILLLALILAPVIALAHGGLEHVRGTIAKVSDGSVTVTTAAGKTVEVLLDAQTTYARAEKPIQKTDLKVGDRVVIHAAEKGTTLTAHTVEVGVSSSKKP